MSDEPNDRVFTFLNVAFVVLLVLLVRYLLFLSLVQKNP